MPVVYKIAIISPFNCLFDYYPPKGQEKILLGSRVKVPFGQREVTGIVMSKGKAEIALDKIKTITAILDPFPVFQKPLLSLLIWISEYYHYSLSHLVHEIIPKKWSSTLGLQNKTPKDTNVDRLEQNHPLRLNKAQLEAVQAVLKKQTLFQVFCLFGVTGSGKTEVYLNIMAPLLQQQKQVLCLIPEINLTPQTLNRFKRFFQQNEISVFHSRLTPKEKAIVWQQALQQQSQIFIGTRSAVFLPFKNLGLIIIDEEHDQSFKQQTKLRYSARDVAVMRAKLENFPIVLGSATPSLETIYNVEKRNYQLLKLPTRAGNATLPVIKLVDLRGKKLIHDFSDTVLKQIEQKLHDREQVLIYLNRRGFAPVLMCKACGFSFHCRNCDAKLTVHLETKKVNCHHCGQTFHLPERCPECQNEKLLMLGIGTEKIAQTLQQIFPEAKIARIDRDTTQAKGAFDDFFNHLEQYQILVGTQMLAKGHHFPNLTLVVIMNVDYPLLSFDYRAEENLVQQIVQVTGRAGRATKPGEVYLQTYNPEHLLLQKIVKNEDYLVLAKDLLNVRRETAFPPYAFLAILQAESTNSEQAVRFLEQVKIALSNQSTDAVKLFGPIPVNLHKKAGKYREQLLIQSSSRKQLQLFLKQLTQNLQKINLPRKLHYFLEVDPLNLNN